MQNIYLITDQNGFFGQSLYPYESLDTDYIISLFDSYDINIIKKTYLDLKQEKITNSIVIPTSSQKKYYKEYINDLLFYLKSSDNIIVPSLDIFLSHENKGYQELHKKKLNIDSLKTLYLTADEINNIEVLNEISYPIVLKTTDGAGSHGVSLIKSKKQLLKSVNKHTLSNTFTSYLYFKEIIKKYFYKKKYNIKRKEYYKNYEKYVLQEFVDNLTYDYKVLIYYDKYYVLKRYIKENDFRASGSGLFKFEEIDMELLDYAKELFDTFDEPMMSFDICYDGNKYYLIEFQGTHFGPYTQMYADGFYIKDNKWLFKEIKYKTEEVFVSSIVSYIKDKDLM